VWHPQQDGALRIESPAAAAPRCVFLAVYSQ
jgi:hypothetical protein